MKALLKGGLLLTLGWLAQRTEGQEHQWRAMSPPQADAIVVAAPQSGAAASGSGVRGVSLSQPVPLSSPSGDGAARAVVRGQAPEPLILQPLPKIETIDKAPAKGDPKSQPKAGAGDKDKAKPLPSGGAFAPPPPTVMPSPVFGELGLGCDDSCVDDLCHPGRGKSRFGHGFDPGCCPERSRIWVDGAYLLWYQRSQQTPPLITSSPVGTPAGQIGILPAATVEYNRVPESTRSGGRFSGGWWSSHMCNIGFDTTFFFLGQLNTSNTFTSDGQRFFARPFFDVTTPPGMQNSEPFSTATRTGFARVNTYSQLWGIDFNVRRKWHCNSNYWLDMLAGYRHVSLREGISIVEDFTVLAGDPSGVTPGTRFTENESFATQNIFHGGQIGLQGEYRWGNRWTLGLTSKVAFGSVTQFVTINGSTTVSQGGTSATQPGALLVTQTNIGRFSQNRFAVVPEVGFKLGYDITDNFRLYVGYDFVYISSVVRPGDQIDTTVNQSFRPFVGGNTGVQRPAVLFRTSDYWAQGLSFGMQYRW